jgi:L-ascorbate metabolism protein UlaG (beta-lactamase superfamily)
MRNHHRIIAIILFGLTAASSAVASGKPGPCNVSYLGNEGFLVECSGKRVLVDALQGDGLRGYVALGGEARERLEAARPPFDDVDLILVSHFHPDHFDAAAVVGYLEREPSAVFVSSEQAIAALQEFVYVDEAMARRIHGLHPPAGERVEIQAKGIDLTVMSFHHGRSEAQNLGLIVDLDGFRFLHVGDTEATWEEFRSWGMAEERLDVAFIPSWLLREPGWKEALAGAEHIVAMHIASPGAPASYFGPQRNRDTLVQFLRSLDPEIVIFNELLQEKTFPLVQKD